MVTTFATGWLIPRLADFEAAHPDVSLRVFTHNNRIEIAKEGLHMAVRFGDREAWPWLEADPLIAARQYAACAAAWRRLTENPTPTDVARGYLEEAERYVALAASVIGEEEAARVAKETRGGPLIRECRL